MAVVPLHGGDGNHSRPYLPGPTVRYRPCASALPVLLRYRRHRWRGTTACTRSWHPPHIHTSPSFWACSDTSSNMRNEILRLNTTVLQGTSQTDTLVRFYDQADCQGESSYVQFQGICAAPLETTWPSTFSGGPCWSRRGPPRPFELHRQSPVPLRLGLRHGGVDLGQLGGPTVCALPPKCDDVRLPCPIDPSPCLHLYGRGRLVPRPVLRRHLATKMRPCSPTCPPPQVFARAPQRALPLDGQHVALPPPRPPCSASTSSWGWKQWQNWTIQSCPRSRSSPWRTTTPPWKPSSFAKWHGSSTTTVPSRRWSPTTLVI